MRSPGSTCVRRIFREIGAKCGPVLGLVALALGPSCSGSSGEEPTPTAALAGSIGAQSELQGLLRDFSRGSRDERLKMKTRIFAFRQAYALTPLGRVADALLAWIAMEEGALEQALREAAFVQTVTGAGTTSDLAKTVQGATLRRMGSPEQALETLTPLVSKLIDGYARALLNEEIVLAAIASKRWQRALSLMGVWLREAGVEEEALVKGKIERALLEIPPEELLKSLSRARGIEVASFAEEEQAIRKLLARRLATVARERRDADLAQQLLQTSGALLGDQGDAVAQLATGVTKARVEPRTVGLLLTLASDETRRRSAEAADGIAQGLGLPGSVARLVSREDRGGPQGVEDALATLSADGASILIAGIDDDHAMRAAKFAEEKQIPVILLRPPARAASASPGRFTFVLGEDPGAVETALAAALVARGSSPVAIVSEDPRRHGDQLAAEIAQLRSCVGVETTGRPAGVLGIVLGASCAREVMRASAGPKIRLAASFEATLFGPLALPKGSVVSTAGIYPIDAAAPPAAIQGWMTDHAAPPGWWAGLGHDAAVLAWAGVRTLPQQGTEDPREVTTRRAQAAQALGEAEVALWTSEARGFGGGRALPRSIGAKELR
ncbi:MAG: hypothetical protein ABI193_02680 [Minicystis sp.]